MNLATPASTSPQHNQIASLFMYKLSAAQPWWNSTKLHLLLTFCRFWAFYLSPKPQSIVKHGSHAMDISPRKKNTHISMPALKVKSTMGIKPPSWVTSVRQILIPRRAIVSGIPLMHGSYNEGKSTEEREMVHVTELSSDCPPLWAGNTLHWTAVSSL